MSKKIALFNCKSKERLQKCPVYLKLPCIGKICLNFEKKTKIAINRCYKAVESCIIFTTRKILPAVHKIVLPTLQQSMVVHQCVCRCDCRYVDRTSQRLQDRINQHIPRCIRSDKRPTKNLPNRECKITSTQGRSQERAGGALAPLENWDVMYFLCLSLKNNSKHIYLNYENNTLWSFCTICVLVQMAGQKEQDCHVK